MGTWRSVQMRANISSSMDLSMRSKLDHSTIFDLGSGSSSVIIVTLVPIITLACRAGCVGGGLKIIMS